MERELFGEDQESKDLGPGVEEIVLKNRPTDIQETSIEKLEPRDLKRRGSGNAAAILEALSGAHITLNAMGQRSISLRGFSQLQAKVLVDGLPAAHPHLGYIDLARISNRMIKRITVIKGTAPVLLQGGAIGGAINIISRDPGDGPLAAVAGEYTAHNTWRAAAEHSLEQGSLAYTVFGGFHGQDSSGLSRDFQATANERPALRNNSDRMDWHAGAAVRYRVSEEHALKGRISYSDGVRGIPPSTQAARPLRARLGAWRSVGISLAHEGTVGRVEFDDTVYVRFHESQLEIFDDDSLESQSEQGSGDTWNRGQSAGGRVRGRTWIDGTPWGLTFIRLTVSADHEGHSEEPAGGGQGAAGARVTISAAPEAEAMLSPCWSLIVGMQLDLELPGEGDTGLGWGPLVSALYAPLESVALRGTVARRTRFPSLPERYGSASSGQAPNLDLGPESAWHMGLEATWRLLPGIVLHGGLFDAEVLDLIVQDQTAGGTGQLVNAASGRYLGLELGFLLSPFETLHLSAAYTFLYARRTDEDAPDEQLPSRPMNKASVELIFAPMSFVELGTFLIIHGERSYLNPGTGAWGSLSPYAIWNARIAVQPVTWVSVFVRASNILGTHHVTEYGFPDQGRLIWLGMDLKYGR